jgi:membrane fusion protein (multidrug efflux system)
MTKKKTVILTIAGLLLVVGLIAGIKVLQIRRMIASGGQYSPPPEPVTTASVQSDTWESLLTAVGSLTAVQGVQVSAEVSGKVIGIDFDPGARVRAGDRLVRLDSGPEEAQLRSAEVALELARLNFERARQLVDKGAVSQAYYDDLEAKLKEAAAQADNLRAIIARKSIRAPFSGRLGIRLINLGQILQEGAPVVSLQSLDPIFINFQLPQQASTRIKTGLVVRLTVDALPDRELSGKITTINPEVDSITRNLRLQATVANPDELLRPGMYANVTLVLPEAAKVRVIPATAVLYAPFGDSVFVVEESKQDDKTGLVVRQQFVKLGEKRGDFIDVLSGLQGDETVVSTGVFKLRNGQAVKVDNNLTPEFKLAPEPEDR